LASDLLGAPFIIKRNKSPLLFLRLQRARDACVHHRERLRLIGKIYRDQNRQTTARPCIVFVGGHDPLIASEEMIDYISCPRQLQARRQAKKQTAAGPR
jgi:hypothetical protein